MDLKIPNETGFLSTVVELSKTKSNKLAILCPGYLDSKEYYHLKSMSTELTSNGYTCVRFDPTGTWDSTGSINDYTMTRYLKDVASIVEYMKRKAKVSNLLVAGHSRGGQAALLYAARNQVNTVIAAMPSGGPLTSQDVHNYTVWEETRKQISYRNIPESRKQRKFVVPFNYLQDIYKYDMITEVARITARVVFIAGELDDVCPPKSVESLFNMTLGPKSFSILKGIGHSYRNSIAETTIVNAAIMSALNF